MAKDTLKVTDKDNREWSISDIPAKLMDEFNVRAGEMYPGKENPWMHLVLDTISSVCDVDKVTYQLTDIPADLMEQFDLKTGECDYTRFSLLSEMLQAAGKGNFVVGRIITERSAPGESVAIVLTGIPTKNWDFFQTLAEEAQVKSGGKVFGDKAPSAMALLCVMMQMVSMDGFTFDWKEDAKAPPKAPPKANSKRSAGVKRGGFGSS